MESFIKKVWNGRADEQAHRQFVRFSRGTFPGRAALSLQKGEKIKLGGSFEFANDFSKFAAELGARFSGIIISREKLELEGKEKSGLYYYDVESIDSGKVMDVDAYALLLDGEGQGVSLKMKKKLPKPGKSGSLKIDDKFCQLELDSRFWNQLKEAFMLPECKKAKISHTIIVGDIEVPNGEKDFAKLREMAKKKGKIIRIAVVDGKESKEERSFFA